MLHSQETRAKSMGNSEVKFCRTKFSSVSTWITVVKLWNDLDKQIQEINSPETIRNTDQKLCWDKFKKEIVYYDVEVYQCCLFFLFIICYHNFVLSKKMYNISIIPLLFSFSPSTLIVRKEDIEINLLKTQIF